MAYGTLKVDNITYTSAGVDASTTVSGLVEGNFPNITITGTISGTTITGDTGDFTTITAVTGIFTNTLSGAVVTAPGASAASPSFIFTGDADTGLYSPGANQVAISTSGTGRLFVDASGLVGIGTSSPWSTFTVGSGGSANPAATATIHDSTHSEYRLKLTSTAFNSSGNWLGLGFGYSDNYLKAGIIAEAKDSNARADLHFCLDGNVNSDNANLDDSKMVITYDGKVGIGTTSPRGRLEVSDGTSNTAGEAINEAYIVGASTGSSEGILTIQSNDAMISDKGGSIAFGGRAVTGSSAGANWAFINGYKENGVSSNYGGYLSFATRPNAGAISERARIDSSGRLLVGTSSAPTVGVPASATFVVQGYAGVPTGDSLISLQRGQAPASISSGAQLGAITFGANDGSPYAQIHAATDGAGGTDDYPGRLVLSSTPSGSASPVERMRISQNGVVTIQNGAVAVIDVLADGATITPDLASGCNFSVSISGNRTLANPTNITAGQTGSIFITQGTGSNALSWGSYWDFPAGTAPTLSTASGAVDRVDYIVRTTTSIQTVFTANYS